ISGASQMLKNSNLINKDETELLSIIHKESLRLAEILDNFLSFVSPKKPEKHLVNIYEVILEVVTLFNNSPLFQEKKLKLSFDFFSKEVFLNVDSNQIKQVLWNLLHNARKASEIGGEIKIKLYSEENWIVVEVSDKGVGMPKSEIEKIQEPFRKGFSQGVGLGLSLVNRIMYEHGGKVEIDSKFGSGTKVKLFFLRDSK
ncbi:MAG: HAMP domain-containing histidine kinase, partial [Acidobacteria bacterium]|nr:HAMP domain-containing histidine kinase [Acidobacteriota bacterium]